MKTLPILLTLLLLSTLNSGCVGYRVGSQLPPDIQTVFVHIPVNSTDEALLENDVSRAFLAQLRRDGSLRLAPEDQADGIVFIEITGYSTEALSFSGADRARPTEYRLLQFFMTHQERAYTRGQLLDQVWGGNVYVEERTVDVHIRRLRKALGEAYENLVQTVRGTGYRFSTKS